MRKNTKRLVSYLDKNNIAEQLSDDILKDICEKVRNDYEIDLKSMSRWLETNKKAFSLIQGDLDGDFDDSRKDFPFEGASKVVYPIITEAIIQIGARLVANLVQNGKIVHFGTYGKDENNLKKEKAKRAESYMNYQLLIEGDEWLPDFHRFLYQFLASGTGFRKIYYDPICGENVAETCAYDDVIINNNERSLKKARRITYKIRLTNNQIREKINRGLFCDILDDGELDASSESKLNQDPSDRSYLNLFLEQFTYLDLDEDGYEEPYLVTYHYDSNKIASIYAAFDVDKDVVFKDELGDSEDIVAIYPSICYVDYHIFHNPSGQFFSMGLNHLFYDQAEVISTLMRQLTDSGTLYNQNAGYFDDGIETKSEKLSFQLGEFKKLKVSNQETRLGDHFYPLPVHEPSQVLLGLLQMMIEQARRYALISDALVGDMPAQNVPATTMLALVEQGTRAMKPLMQSIYTSLKREFKLWAKLNAEYLSNEEYFKFQDEQMQISRDDYILEDFDICPVADPTMSSDAQKYAKMQFLQTILQLQLPEVNRQAILLDIFKDMGYAKPEEYVIQPQPAQPDPKAQVEAAKLELQKHQLQSSDQQAAFNQQMQEKDHEIKLIKLHAEQTELRIKELLAKVKQDEARTRNQESAEKQQALKAKATKDIAEAKIKPILAEAQLLSAKAKQNVDRLDSGTGDQDDSQND